MHIITAVVLAALAGPFEPRPETPRARIEGPARVPAGTPIFLDGRKSSADPSRPLQWKVLGEPVALLTFDDAGRDDVVALVPTAEAGKTYRFVLVAVGTANPGEPLQVDVALLEVAVTQGGSPAVPVGPTPPVNPAPPAPVIPPAPAPAGRFGLAAAARDAALLVAQPPEHRALVARALANGYRSVASQAAAGALPSPEAVLAATRETNRAVLGNNLDAWKVALDALKTRIDALAGERRLATSSDLGDAWREIAEGLDLVAKGAP
jgi:hypothetical protein